MNVIPETRHAHYIWYLRFYYLDIRLERVVVKMKIGNVYEKNFKLEMSYSFDKPLTLIWLSADRRKIVI